MAINIIDKNLSFNSNHTNRKGNPKAIVLHHAACNGSVEDIHRSHKARGYAGIGYHFYVRKDGTIYRGRPEAWQGGHTLNHNEKLGICAEGNFENEQMSAAQKAAIIELLKYLYDKYGQLPVYRHKDLGSTACPGKNYPFDEIVALSKKTTTTPAKTENKTQATSSNTMTDKQKQIQLQFLGYYWGEIDGDFGTNSKQATKEFQDDFGLSVDGDFGPNTIAKSIEVIKQIQKAVGATQDGLAGPNTKEATKQYQAKNGLVADGIAGPATRAHINNKSNDDFWKSIKYFEKEEMACKCGKYCSGYPTAVSEKLMKLADKIRYYYGKPMIISSGLRCKTHNKNVGGVSNSRHMSGTAMDFMVQGKTAKEVLAYVQKQPEVRYAYAIDSLYVHMDVK